MEKINDYIRDNNSNSWVFPRLYISNHSRIDSFDTWDNIHNTGEMK